MGFAVISGAPLKYDFSVDKFLDAYLQIIWFSVLGAVLPHLLLRIQEEVCKCQGIPINPLHPLSPLEVFCVSALLIGALLSVLGL